MLCEFGLLFVEDASSSPDVSAENSRASSPDLPDTGIRNASNFLENETLKSCLDKGEVPEEKDNTQENMKTNSKPLQETIGMIDVVKKCVDEEEGDGKLLREQKGQ